MPEPPEDSGEGEFLEILRDLDRAVRRNRLTEKYRTTAELLAEQLGCRWDDEQIWDTKDEEGGPPYPWQVTWHDAGADNVERAIIAANQVGKTRTIAAEVGVHNTGIYPSWWKGRRFDCPNEWFVSGETNKSTRDICQRALLGKIQEDRAPTGEGWIPKSLIGLYKFRTVGIPDVLDTVQVRHIASIHLEAYLDGRMTAEQASDGWSEIQFMSHEMGDTKFQGVPKHGCWLDEEPYGGDDAIYNECLARLLKRRGIMLWSRTPLFGRTKMVQRFAQGGKGIFYISAGWKHDAPHLSAEEKARLIANYPAAEGDTRSTGRPLMGGGGIYTANPKLYTCEPFPIPRHWRKIIGLDFGLRHAFAIVCIAHDADNDVVIVHDAYKVQGQTPIYHSGAIRARGGEAVVRGMGGRGGTGRGIPVAWPHDGELREKGSAKRLADHYLEHGVNLLPVQACYTEDKLGAQPREPITNQILERMLTGRLRVFAHLTDLLEELSSLHRDRKPPHRIVAEFDDEESALRMAVMMLRYAASEAELGAHRQPGKVVMVGYDPLAR